MVTKRFPRTYDEYAEAMHKAQDKANSIARIEDRAFDEETLTHLNTFLPLFDAKKVSMKVALAKQTTATRAKEEAFDVVAIYISHFIQSFNMGIVRKMFPETHRNYYGLDVNSSRVPDLYKEADLDKWSGEIETGEAARVAAGGVPMAMPTAAQVKTEYLRYKALKTSQSGLKDAYDTGQEDLQAMMREARSLVQDIHAGVDYKFHRETISSFRRKAREYGFVYVNEKGEVVADEPTGPLTGTVAPQTSAIIKQSGFDVNSMFIATNKGPVFLKLYTAAKADDAVPSTTVDLAPGEQKEVWASELGADTNTFFMVYNPDKTIAGSWEVTEGEEE
jgi:hypothetical protein